MIAGLDLVEGQWRVAAVEALPLTQEQVPLNGHSTEVRLYAGEPEKGFLPSIGRLVHFASPDASAPVRLDTRAEQGDPVTPHADPWPATLTGGAHTHHAAADGQLLVQSPAPVVRIGQCHAPLSRIHAL